MIKLLFISIISASTLFIPEKKLETGFYYVKDNASSSTVSLKLEENGLESIIHLDTLAICTKEDFKDVKVEIIPSTLAEMPVISIKLSEEGGKKFAEATEKSVSKKIAIVHNGNIISAPYVNEPIYGGELQISGKFTLEEAEKIKNELTEKSETK